MLGAGGRKAILTKVKIRMAEAAMRRRETVVTGLCVKFSLANLNRVFLTPMFPRAAS
jgi:hypothetical protein